MPRRHHHHKRIAKSFGLLLRRHRLAAGLTQYELAHRSGIDVSFLSRMERGLTQPSIGTFMHLATIIGISPVEWMRQLVTNELEEK